MVNGTQIIQMPKEGEYVKLKNYERKTKSPFMIYVDFENILVSKLLLLLLSLLLLLLLLFSLLLILLLLLLLLLLLSLLNY